MSFTVFCDQRALGPHGSVPDGGEHALDRIAGVVSRMWWKFPGDVFRACEGSASQAARSRGIGSIG